MTEFCDIDQVWGNKFRHQGNKDQIKNQEKSGQTKNKNNNLSDNINILFSPGIHYL